MQDARSSGGSRAAARRPVPLVLAALLTAGLGLPPAAAPAQPADDGRPVEVEVARDSDLPGAWALNPGLLEVRDHPEEDVLEIWLGPVYLPGGMPHMRAPVQLMRVPFDGWLHGFSWQIVDREGNPLPDRFLHHVNIVDVDGRELFSPMARRVVAAGRETAGQELPEIFGYPFQEGTRWAVIGMFANDTDTDYPRAFLRLKLHYSREGETLVRPRSVYPFYTDVMGPVGPKSFPVPPGHVTKSWTGTPAVDGRIIGLGGHLHDYATELRLEDAATGDTLWRVEPETGDDPHHVVRVPVSRVWARGGIPVRAGKEYRVVAEYRNPLDRPTPHGGMGVVAGAVLADTDEWPPVDRNAPAYREDTRNMMTAPVSLHPGGEAEESGGGHGHGGH